MFKLYNTLSKKKELFTPIGKSVGIYSCGPTVYDYAHIGNFRAFIFADILKRYIEYLGYPVKHIMNITDVGHMTSDSAGSGEDKIEKSAREQKKKPEEIADFYAKAFFDDIQKIRLSAKTTYPRATQHVQDMINLIKILVDKKYAYISNNSVYYNIDKFKRYGKLSGNTLSELKAGAGGRVKNNPDKKNQFDFALWISDPKHMMQWDSPFGRGYPGWHIECSAMSMKYLGESFDIHTGGEDNKFPHHECEIAQSEGATSKKLAKYWLHASHLLVDGEKMSKSLGNFYTLRDIIVKGYDPLAFRYLCVSSHYRKNLDFTLGSLEAAKTTLDRINSFFGQIQDQLETQDKNENELILYSVKDATIGFESAMNDDLNTPDALSVLFELMNVVNKEISAGRADSKSLEKVLQCMLKFNSVLDILYEEDSLTEDEKILIEDRQKFRADKNYKKSDKIRDLLMKKGVFLEDTTQGVKWKKFKRA